MFPKNLDNETALLRQVAEGDEVAFRALFYGYRPQLMAFVWGMSKSEQLAEDVVHDVFMDIWAKREQLTEVKHFNAWLFKAVRYKVRRIFQRKAKETLIIDELQRDNEGSGYEDKERITNNTVLAFIHNAVEQLTPQQKKVFLLSRHMGLSHAEIAARLGVNTQTVSNHLSDALRFLRKELSAFYGQFAVALFVLHELF